MALNLLLSRTFRQCPGSIFRVAPAGGLHGFSPAFAFARAASSLKPVLKDPDCPKRPTSSWINYLADFRAAQNKDVKAKEVLKLASAKWKALPAVEKKPYEEKAEAAKKAYHEATQKYIESGHKDAWHRDPERPKAPVSGYFRFLAQFRANNTDIKMTEQAKNGAQAWKALSEAEKAPFNEAAKKDKDKFDEAMKAYKASGKEEVWKEKVGIKAKEDKEAGAKTKLKEKLKAEKEKAKKKELDSKAKQAKLKAQAKEVKEKAAAAKAKSQAKASSNSTSKFTTKASLVKAMPKETAPKKQSLAFL